MHLLTDVALLWSVSLSGFLASQAAAAVAYNCEEGNQHAWSQEKVNYCCLSEGIGCPGLQANADPYDCDDNSESWEHGWSSHKKMWCCEHRGRGCKEDAEHANACSTACTHQGKHATCHSVVALLADEPALGTMNACEAAHGAMLQKCPHCWVCSLAASGCSAAHYSNGNRRYECFASPPFHWTAEKRAWCCKHAQRGCKASNALSGAAIHLPAVETTSVGTTSTTLAPTTTTPQGCDTSCVLRGQPITCRAKILQVHNDAFRTTLHGCALAHELTLQVCPGCHVCALDALPCVQEQEPPTTSVVRTTIARTTSIASTPTTSTVTRISTITSTSTLFDCQAGLTNFNQGWSPVKKSWCCVHDGIACTATSTTTSLPFDCQAGASNWQDGWSQGKKDWCCPHEQLGCTTTVTTTSEPYDCEAGYSNWEKGWSHSKKSWCCERRNRGCPATTTIDPACSTICSFQGKSMNCKSLVHYFVVELFRGDTSTCSTAVDSVHHHCPACSSCDAALAGCEDHNAKAPTTAKWTTFQGNHYVLVDELASWDQHNATCKFLGAHMVTITSKAENDFVTSLMPKAHTAHRWEWLWIGMTKVSLDSWIDGTNMTYKNWAEGQPSTRTAAEQACGEIFVPTGKNWHDNSCSEKSRSVCERDTNSSAERFLHSVVNFTALAGKAKGSVSASTSRPAEAHASLFDCSHLHSTNWKGVSDARKKWCCKQYALRGCPPQDEQVDQQAGHVPQYGYDCEAGRSNWKKEWDTGKQKWCWTMLRQKRIDDANQSSESSTSTYPYDCKASSGRIESWSTDKRVWCCQVVGSGCPSTTTRGPMYQALRVLSKQSSQEVSDAQDGPGSFQALQDGLQPEVPTHRKFAIPLWATRGVGGFCLLGFCMLFAVAFFGGVCRRCVFGAEEESFQRVPQREETDPDDSARTHSEAVEDVRNSARGRKGNAYGLDRAARTEASCRTLAGSLSGEPPASARSAQPPTSARSAQQPQTARSVESLPSVIVLESAQTDSVKKISPVPALSLDNVRVVE